MKITSFFMGIFLVFILCIGIVMAFFNMNVGNELYEEQAYKQLITIAESKAERVGQFLDNRKADAVFLAGSDDVRSIFDEELINDVEILSEKVLSVAENAKEEIEIYLLEHPNMSISDLQNDEMFQSIAVQNVGETGYTTIGSMESDLILFHRDPKQIGFDIKSLKTTNPALWRQYLQTIEFKKSFGFYSFRGLDGKLRDQYHYTLGLDVSASDGGELFLTAIAFVDEFEGAIRVASDLDKELRSFQVSKGYSDLIFINSEGLVVWSVKQHNEFGTNLISGVYSESLLANVFNKAKKDLGVGVSDSQAYGPEGKLEIFITAPVMGKENITGKMELQGIVALELDGEKISDLIETDLLLGEAGEVYIINRNRNHITPLKFDSDGDYNIIFSEGIENCFNDYNNYYFELQGENIEKVAKAATYLDYAEEPNMVLGAHQYILESGWCVIAEMDEDYFLSIVPNTNSSLVINLFTLVFLLLVSSLLLDSFFKVKRRGV